MVIVSAFSFAFKIKMNCLFIALIASQKGLAFEFFSFSAIHRALQGPAGGGTPLSLDVL